MKSKLRFPTLILLLSLTIMSACQTEIVEITEPPADEVITPNSTVADLIQKTALRDGSADNIIDHASCISTVLPVSVIANGLEIIVDSEEDFKTLELIFDEFDDDEDIIEIIFPVTIILSDYTEIAINNEGEFETYREACQEDGDDDDIECVDFVYPLTFSIYDSDKQLSDVTTVYDDKELHDFFDDLEDGDLISFDFPISILLTDGEEIVINNNDELEDMIQMAIDGCDEDDDSDFNDDDIDDSGLINTLINGEWGITYFFNKVDETSDFASYTFTFYEDGSVIANDGILNIEGTWSSYGGDGKLEFEMDFGENNFLEKVGEDWDVAEFDNTIIKLLDKSNINEVHYLTFERPEDNSGGDDSGNSNTDSTFSEVLVSGSWLVALYEDADENKTIDYENFVLVFNQGGSVSANNGMDVINGSWSTVEDNNIDKLVLDFGESNPFGEFNDDWQIVEFSAVRISLTNGVDGDGVANKLVFEKN